MKTTGFRLLQLGTPWRNLSYIIVETDEGITGIGKARVLGKTHTVAEYLKDVERHFIGHDPFDIDPYTEDLHYLILEKQVKWFIQD